MNEICTVFRGYFSVTTSSLHQGQVPCRAKNKMMCCNIIAAFIKKYCQQPPIAQCSYKSLFNRLTPNDQHMGHTAPLTSKSCILCIYSTNTGTEYLKHALYSTFFFSSKCSLFHNANLFGSCIIHILYMPTGCAKIKKK